VFGTPLFVSGQKGMPPAWVFALAIPLSMAGTMCGGWVLDRISDVNFKRWTAIIVSVIGLFYLAQAARAWS